MHYRCAKKIIKTKNELRKIINNRLIKKQQIIGVLDGQVTMLFQKELLDMSIKEITNAINNRSIANNSPFAKIQKLRSVNLKINPQTWKPFGGKAIKEEYAFHSGGRKELQFNIAIDWINEKDVVRYGVAFSLKEDRTIHNSKAEFKDSIDRFNKFLVNNQSFFSDYSMWYYTSHSFGELFNSVVTIDSHLFKKENFIFIGNYLEKKIDEVNDDDIDQILDSFDYLMPLYEYVQFGIKTEKRIARLTYNTNGWIMPSGRYGKSKNKDTHEFKYGYGHEEWIFDTSKQINGYKYGFLEPIRKSQKSYSNGIFNVWLYTINSETQKRYWVGEIKGVEVLDIAESREIYKEYKDNGWLKEMERQIRMSNSESNSLSNFKNIDLFNIKYRTENLFLNDENIELEKSNPIYGLSRYVFAMYKDEFGIKEQYNEDFQFNPNTDELQTENILTKSTYHRESKPIEISYLHDFMSKALAKKLKTIYGKNNVSRENKTGVGGTRIDMVVNSEVEGTIFFELKTYNSLKYSIREAIGQLLEYSMWVSTSKANKLIVLTQKHSASSTSKAKAYFNHLRKETRLEIYYQYFDIETQELSDRF